MERSKLWELLICNLHIGTPYTFEETRIINNQWYFSNFSCSRKRSILRGDYYRLLEPKKTRNPKNSWTDQINSYVDFVRWKIKIPHSLTTSNNSNHGVRRYRSGIPSLPTMPSTGINDGRWYWQFFLCSAKSGGHQGGHGTTAAAMVEKCVWQLILLVFCV